MAKLNKKNTEDLFAGLKYTDKLLNEAAGVGNPPKTQSFEEKMKMKLKEGIEEAEEVNEDLMEEPLDEYNTNQSYDYNYNYDGKNQVLGEEEPEFSDDDDDDYGVEAGLEDDMIGDRFGDLEDRSPAARFAKADMENEFDMDNDEFSSNDEDEFDFTEDASLMEALLEDEPALDVPEDTEVPTMDAAADGAAPIEATPTDETGGVDMTTDAGLGDTGAEVDMGADLGAGADMGGAPSMGAPMGGAPEASGMEDQGADMGTTPVSGAEDIDQLIADLVSGTGAEEQPAVFGENAHNDLGFKDLGDDDINSNKVKVKMESKKGVNPFAKKDDEKEVEGSAKDKKEDKKKEVKESEIKLTKLGDADITGNVKGAISGKAVEHSGTGKRNDPKGEEYTDLGDDDITSNKVGKQAEKHVAPANPKFAVLKKENEEKTKALYTLAEQVITLQDEIANLKFSKFKLEKVNSVLTLLPELKLATREKLVEKFDTCKSYAEAKKLYSEVAEMVKDHKRGSLNEAVLKTQKSTKYFSEGVDNEVNESDDKETARRNMLMGLKGYDDSYGAF